MYELYQTLAAGDLKANANTAFEMAQKGPVVILSRATPKAIMVTPQEWNRMANRLRLLEALQEAKRIEAENNATQTWVSSDAMRTRMAKHGVVVEG